MHVELAVYVPPMRDGGAFGDDQLALHARERVAPPQHHEHVQLARREPPVERDAPVRILQRIGCVSLPVRLRSGESTAAPASLA